MRTEACLDLHRRHGFQLVEHVGDFQRAPFSPVSDTGSVFVFHKP
jgi:hypothetical protein